MNLSTGPVRMWGAHPRDEGVENKPTTLEPYTQPSSLDLNILYVSDAIYVLPIIASSAAINGYYFQHCWACDADRRILMRHA